MMLTTNVNFLKMRSFLCTLTVALATLAAGISHAAGLNTRFIAPAPAVFNTKTITSYTYTDAINFDKHVVVGGQNMGVVLMDYSPWTGKSPSNNAAVNTAGASLSGGFYYDHSKLATGYNLEWVQTVTADRTGGGNVKPTAGGWMLPATNAGEYPDATPTDAQADPAAPFAPAYPFISPQVLNAPATNPDLGFQDAPNRFWSDNAPNTPQNWTAELALVAISTAVDVNGFHAAKVIDSFLWGFTLTTGPNAVTNMGPSSFGPPTASFLATENAFYSGTSPTSVDPGGGNFGGVTTDKYKFTFDQSALLSVPEPGTLVLFALGAVGLVAVGRRRKNASRVAP